MNRWFLTITLLAFCQGCGETKLETQQGLQEQNAVLQDQVQSEKETIADLRRQIDGYRAELEKVKADTSRDAAAQITALKKLQQDELKAFDDRSARSDETHRKQIAQLEGTISSLQLELGAVRREKLALQELVDREPRIAEAHTTRSRLELTVLSLLLGASLLLLGFLAVRHRGVRERLHLLLMQRVAEMRHLGHSHE